MRAGAGNADGDVLVDVEDDLNLIVPSYMLVGGHRPYPASPFRLMTVFNDPVCVCICR